MEMERVNRSETDRWSESATTLMLFFFFSAWRIASPVCRRAVRSQVLYLCSPGTTEIPRAPANHKVSQRLSQHFPGGSGRDFSRAIEAQNRVFVDKRFGRA